MATGNSSVDTTGKKIQQKKMDILAWLIGRKKKKDDTSLRAILIIMLLGLDAIIISIWSAVPFQTYLGGCL